MCRYRQLLGRAMSIQSAAEAKGDQPQHDPAALAESLASAADKSAKLLGEFAARNAHRPPSVFADQLGVGKAFFELAAKMLANPYRLDEFERGIGPLKISMRDSKAFDLGVSIATTAGKIVFQNDLMQLIKYVSTTRRKWQRPLLMIPPWLNKSCILDLREKNSFIRW